MAIVLDFLSGRDSLFVFGGVDILTIIEHLISMYSLSEIGWSVWKTRFRFRSGVKLSQAAVCQQVHTAICFIISDTNLDFLVNEEAI